MLSGAGASQSHSSGAAASRPPFQFSGDVTSHEAQIALREYLVKHFDLSELEILVNDALGLSLEDLSGSGKSGKCLSLVQWCFRRGRLKELAEALGWKSRGGSLNKAPLLDVGGKKLRTVLVNSGFFDSQRSIRVVFTSDDRIAPWQWSIPESSSSMGRVDLLISEFMRQTTTRGENVLAIFIEVLAQMVNDSDALKGELMAFIS